MHPITGLPYSMNGGLIADEALADEMRDLIANYRNRPTPEHLDEATAREMILAPLRRADAERIGKQRARDLVRQRVDAMPMRSPMPARVLHENLPDDLSNLYVLDAINELIRDRTLVAAGIGDDRTMERARS